jgi:hypothetical protein
MQAAMKNRQGAMVIGVAAVATVVGLGGAYMLGRQSAISTAGASTATKPALPGAHPPIADGKADAKAAEPQREGRVEVDKNRQFVHFRVGNKNVMRRVNDGFTPLELLGLTAMIQHDILDQMRGVIKVDIVKREMVAAKKGR